MADRSSRSSGLVILGAVAIAAGLVAMFGSLGFLSLAWVTEWWGQLRWPIVLIIGGIAVILFASRGGEAVRSVENGPWRHHARLYRSKRDRWVAGVLGGLAAYFGMNADAVRLVFLALVLLGAPWIVAAYIIMAIVVPEESDASEAPAATQSPAGEGAEIVPAPPLPADSAPAAPPLSAGSAPETPETAEDEKPAATGAGETAGQKDGPDE